MRISDWSSDVCSSDLSRLGRCGAPFRAAGRDAVFLVELSLAGLGGRRQGPPARPCLGQPAAAGQPEKRAGGQGDARPGKGLRSEEHTSELQSLMRISYAVFCLKKKKSTQLQNTKYNNH